VPRELRVAVSAWLRARPLPYGLQVWVEGRLDVSPRTVQGWVAHDPSERRPGRPAAGPRERWSALRAVARASREKGQSAGRLVIERALEPRQPRRLIVTSLARWKARWRREEREQLLAHRTSVQVLYRDVLWSQDGTHLGRTEDGAVHAQVSKEGASRGTLRAQARQGANTGADVVSQLEALRVARGLPLILGLDNGPENIAAAVEAYLARHQVVALYNVPRTPQHNARAERGIGELKRESGLGKGVRLASVGEAQQQLDMASERLTRRRLRACLGWCTAEQADRTLPCWYGVVDRGRFYAAACSAIRQAVLGTKTLVQRRRAERKAILDLAASVGLVRVTRGGVLLAPAKREGVL